MLLCGELGRCWVILAFIQLASPFQQHVENDLLRAFLEASPLPWNVCPGASDSFPQPEARLAPQQGECPQICAASASLHLSIQVRELQTQRCNTRASDAPRGGCGFHTHFSLRFLIFLFFSFTGPSCLTNPKISSWDSLP